MTDGSVDEEKGRAKEAAGAVTDDDKALKREGKADQAEPSVKGGLDRAAEKVKSLFGRSRK
jgi:uncharacterized protein YjbJ (UPF0337 family)